MQCADELARAWRPRQLQEHRTAIRLSCDAESQEPAALSFGLDRSSDLRERLAVDLELQPDALRGELSLLGSTEQICQQPLFPGAKSRRLGPLRTVL
jgi:hypothetical protein